MAHPDGNRYPLAGLFREGKCGLINHAIYYIFPLFFLAPGRVAGFCAKQSGAAALRSLSVSAGCQRRCCSDNSCYA